MDLLADGVLGDLEPDDGSRETSVTIEARFELVDGDGDLLARATASDTATVSVERELGDADEYGAIGGAGTLTIETG